MALTTGIPENKLRVIAPDVGGGFGAKLQFYREEILATVIANRLGRPVKWTETRSENMVGHPPRPRPDPGHRDRRHPRRARSSG